MDNEPKYKTAKHIDDNTGGTDLGLGNDVLDTTPKIQSMRETLNNLNVIDKVHFY